MNYLCCWNDQSNCLELNFLVEFISWHLAATSDNTKVPICNPISVATGMLPVHRATPATQTMAVEETVETAKAVIAK